jgi:sugar phosphate permease
MVSGACLGGGGCKCYSGKGIIAISNLKIVRRFIIDGIITLPVAIYGYLLFPDTPRNTRAPYLSADEKALAISRVPEVSERTPISWAFLKHCFGTWYWYMFVILWILAGETESFSTNALLQLYMKSHPGKKYTVSQINNYPTGVPAVGIVSTLFWATLTDFMGGKRYLGMCLPRISTGKFANGCSGILDWDHWCNHKCSDPSISTEHVNPLCYVLLGRQCVRLPSNVFRMGERRTSL